MTISDVAKKTGLTAKSIRLYEEKHILKPPLRGANGYRSYSQANINDLMLIARARRVGFNLDECRALVMLANDPKRRSAQVKERAQKKLTEVNKKLVELNEIKAQLEFWIDECPGDDGCECPIINELQSGICHCGH